MGTFLLVLMIVVLLIAGMSVGVILVASRLVVLVAVLAHWALALRATSVVVTHKSATKKTSARRRKKRPRGWLMMRAPRTTKRWPGLR